MYKDLPPELRQELLCCREDDLRDKLIAIVSDAGEAGVSLDEILVSLYRRHSKIYKRRFIQNKIYRSVEIAPKEGARGRYVCASNCTPTPPPERKNNG